MLYQNGQNSSFSANCICLEVRWNEGGAPAELMTPAPPPMDTFGLLNCGVFVTLKNSPRNCMRILSVKAMFLNREASSWWVPGPVMMSRPAFPNVN